MFTPIFVGNLVAHDVQHGTDMLLLQNFVVLSENMRLERIDFCVLNFL